MEGKPPERFNMEQFMSKSTENTTSNGVVAYYRVSTNEQSESGLGLEAQQAVCRAYAAKNGLTIISEHTDAGLSGRAPLEQRTALVAAMASVVANKPAAIGDTERCAVSLIHGAAKRGTILTNCCTTREFEPYSTFKVECTAKIAPTAITH